MDRTNNFAIHFRLQHTTNYWLGSSFGVPCPKHTVHYGFASTALPFLNFFIHNLIVFSFLADVLYYKDRNHRKYDRTQYQQCKNLSKMRGAAFPTEYDSCPSCGYNQITCYQLLQKFYSSIIDEICIIQDYILDYQLCIPSVLELFLYLNSQGQSSLQSKTCKLASFCIL